MPTYERWKACGVEENGRRCGEIAGYECTAGCTHKEDVEGWANPPEELADHPRFACDRHAAERGWA